MAQLTFSEEEVKNLKGLMEFIRDKTRFNISMDEAVQLYRYAMFMQSHIKKVNDHIMEFRGMVQADTVEDASKSSNKKNK
jgi:hypothetical protein